MDVLTGEFKKLEDEFVKKGLSPEQVQKLLQGHVRDQKSLKKSTATGKTKLRKYAVWVISLAVAVLAAGSYVYWDTLVNEVMSVQCIVESNVLVSEIARPLQKCSLCENLKTAPIERELSSEDFLKKYAYTGVPVLIKDATKNWTAMQTFNFDYFRRVYTKHKGALKVIEDDCQFFGYKTEFDTLADALGMPVDRAAYKPGEKPWYFGWSNCHPVIEKELRKHYQRPYFLPKDSESSSIDWIFMGGPGPGAFIHLDFVMKPSWQAQISGTKTWTLIPAPECEHVCHNLNITVEQGDIIVVDTNQWYHATHVHPGPLSICIGSEYD